MTDVRVGDGVQDDVRADVNYIRNRPGPADAVLEFVTEDETQSTMVTRPGVPVRIEDDAGSPPTSTGRGSSSSPT